MLARAKRYSGHAHWSRLAGNLLAGQGRWGAALPLLEQAFRAEPSALGASDLARVRRAAARDPQSVDLDDLLATSQRLRLVLGRSFEGDVPPIPDDAAELRQGNIAAAASRLEGNSELLPLVAASDGAPPELITRVLEMPVGERDQRALVALLALAVRTKRDAAPYLQPLLTALADHPGVGRFFTELSRRRVPSAALLEGVPPTTRGLAYTTAVVALGASCPKAWRAQAKALLFIGERPYLH